MAKNYGIVIALAEKDATIAHLTRDLQEAREQRSAAMASSVRAWAEADDLRALLRDILTYASTHNLVLSVDLFDRLKAKLEG